MKQVGLFCTVIAVAAFGGWAITDACEKDKTSQASAASYASAHCTAAQAAACKANMAKGANAVTASMDHCADKASAATASTDHCADRTSAATAAMDHCAGKASAATASMDHCAGMSMSAAGHSCLTGKAAGVTAGSHVCNGAATASSHIDCDACADMVGCAEQINSVGASSQVVPLKNGVMFVYTADSPGKVRAVQAALARRSERMAAMTAAGDKTHLCSECKAMRGAAASGKLTREVVNIEGGCLTLMTSNDPHIVAKIHSMAGVQTASRTKL